MKYLKILFFLYIGLSYSQEKIPLIKKPKAEQQNYWFENGEKALNKGEIEKAFYLYTRCSLVDTLSTLTELSKSKSDSLKKSLRKKLLKEIKGKWNLIKSGTNWGFSEVNERTEKLIIRQNKIIFHTYSTEKKKYIKKVEKINFSNLFGSLHVQYNELIFSDGQIWSFELTEKGSLRLKNTGQLNKKSRNLISCGNFEKYYKRNK